MARRRRRGGASGAAADAVKLGAAAVATASAAGQTVALRGLMLARSAGEPHVSAEILRMTTEKALAAGLSGAALAAHGPRLWRLWFGAATAPWAFASASMRATSSALAPYRRATRANAKRLTAKRRMS